MSALKPSRPSIGGWARVAFSADGQFDTSVLDTPFIHSVERGAGRWAR